MINVVDRVPTYPNRIKVTKSDGTSEYVTWERADEPTVVGTPINKALFDSIVEDIGLNKNTTVYVSTAGSDTLGDGTAANPYASIQKAINSLPKNLNGYNATISIVAGIYNEDVVVSGLFGGNIIFFGAAEASVSLQSLRIMGGVSAEIQNIKLEITNGYSGNAITIANSIVVCTSSMKISGAVENGLYVSRNGVFIITEDFEVVNARNAAISTLNHSRVSLNSLLGSMSSGAFIRATNGALVSYRDMNVSAPVLYSTASGGRIYSGAQTSIPNY